jgi:hypothetical protein
MRTFITIFIPFFIVFLSGCVKDPESEKLAIYLNTFNLKSDTYKVICFVPIDGCGTCINPSLNYAKHEKHGFLLIMTSMFRKSIENTLEKTEINPDLCILDSGNMAVNQGLVSSMAPLFYFLENGAIVKKFDLSKTSNINGVIEEVDEFLKNK